MGLNVLSAIDGMSALWDVRYWEVSQCKVRKNMIESILISVLKQK